MWARVLFYSVWFTKESILSYTDTWVNAVKVLGKPALCMEIKYRPWENPYCAHMGGLHGKHMELILPSVNWTELAFCLISLAVSQHMGCGCHPAFQYIPQPYTQNCQRPATCRWASNSQNVGKYKRNSVEGKGCVCSECWLGPLETFPWLPHQELLKQGMPLSFYSSSLAWGECFPSEQLHGNARNNMWHFHLKYSWQFRDQK